MPIIHSLLETDLYKFTMWQAMLHDTPSNQAEYRFVCRNVPDYPLSDLKPDIESELDALCRLEFSCEELDYLRSLRFMKSDFVDFLSVFRFQRRFIHVGTEGDTLTITAKGPQIHITAFEIPVLAIVNESYYRRCAGSGSQQLETGRRKLAEKIRLVRDAGREGCLARRHPFEFFDFGLRRRFSRDWHAEVVSTLKAELPEHFRGTSNVFLAKEFGLTPIGTMAHEYLQTYQAVDVQLRNFQKAALEKWVQEYRGDLGIALTDVVGMDAFLRDFDLYFAKLFDGLRHDSGDPIEWGEKALTHYAKLRIDAHTKRLVFSDALTIAKALALYVHFADRIMTGFGIGTHLSNDVGFQPLNIVMKLINCNGQPTAKLSDSPGKTLCSNKEFLAYLRQQFHLPPPEAVR